MKPRKLSNASRIAALLAIVTMALFSCTGDTDGGSAGDAALVSNPFVDNGGAGAKIELEIESTDNQVGVGEEVPFRVRVTDPQGAPLQFVRIFCDTELGVAITEPARNGVAVETTSARGYMSGSIGGVTPGSYIMECRAQAGFNLVDRVSVRVTGQVLAGFQGFPGAAGGNLGGGRIVDRTPDANDGNGVRISSITVSDASSSSSSSGVVLDVVRNGCRDTATPPTCTSEPFTFNTFTLSIKNDTGANAFINTVEVRQGSRTVVSAQGVPAEVKKGGGSSDITGIFTTSINCSADKCFNTGGTNNLSIGVGSRNYTFIVTGTTEAGDSFEISRTAAILFDSVNNCTAGLIPGALCS